MIFVLTIINKCKQHFKNENHWPLLITGYALLITRNTRNKIFSDFYHAIFFQLFFSYVMHAFPLYNNIWQSSLKVNGLKRYLIRKKNCPLQHAI